MLAGMFGLHGITLGPADDLVRIWGWIVSLGLIAVLAPNSQEILRDWQPVLEPLPFSDTGRDWRWHPSIQWGLVTACVAVAGVLSISNSGEFLYWQF